MIDPVAICGPRFIPRFLHGQKAMPSEESLLCFGGGEQWSGDRDHHPQTANHLDKAHPAAAVTSPLVDTDNASPRSFLAPGPRKQANAPPGQTRGETAREQT